MSARTFRTCERCGREIPRGDLLTYAGGGVWHPACFREQFPATAKPNKTKKRKPAGAGGRNKR